MSFGKHTNLNEAHVDKAVRYARSALFTKENENGELISFEENDGFYVDSTFLKYSEIKKTYSYEE